MIHRRLKGFIERNDSSGLSSPVIEKVRNVVTFLQEIEDVQELLDIPGWKVHQLTGNRKGTWSLTVTRTGGSLSGSTGSRKKYSTSTMRTTIDGDALSALLNSRAALSPEMALRIEKAFSPKMDTLLRMQTAYEIAETRDREREIKVKGYVSKRIAPREPVHV